MKKKEKINFVAIIGVFVAAFGALLSTATNIAMTILKENQAQIDKYIVWSIICFIILLVIL